MGKYTRLLVWLVVIIVPSGYAIHLYRNYDRIRDNLKMRALTAVRPQVDTESISEVVYIFDMRFEKHIRKEGFNLVWFIAVPSTGKNYSCSYSLGFQDFEVGDGVRLIHKRDDSDPTDYSGYITGLNFSKKDKNSEVWALDLAELDYL